MARLPPSVFAFTGKRFLGFAAAISTGRLIGITLIHGFPRSRDAWRDYLILDLVAVATIGVLMVGHRHFRRRSGAARAE